MNRRKTPTLLWLAGLAFQFWIWRQLTRKRAHERRLMRSRALPHQEQTWEGEGGALPRSGPQLGPNPSHVRPKTG
ncbi:MAG: hypothetical protein ACM3VZ_02825 [Acidobacteriota bacterium]